MSTTLAPMPTLSRDRSLRQTITVYGKEAKYEFLKLLRFPMYSVSTILFPLMFYVLFGLVFGRQQIGGMNQSTYLIASYGTFGVMGASLFGTAAGLAAERGLGWMQVKRASPMPPFAYFAAKFAISMAFSAIVMLLLMLLAVSFGGVTFSVLEAVKLLATLIAGSIPFCAMGLVIGYFAGPNSAPATINLIYLPMSFLSGLWIPYMFLPKLMQKFALVLPPYHLSQLALSVVGAGRHEANWGHWQVLIAFTLICLGFAYWGFLRDEGKIYG